MVLGPAHSQNLKPKNLSLGIDFTEFRSSENNIGTGETLGKSVGVKPIPGQCRVHRDLRIILNLNML